jgi:hypothetical protein
LAPSRTATINRHSLLVAIHEKRVIAFAAVGGAGNVSLTAIYGVNMSIERFRGVVLAAAFAFASLLGMSEAHATHGGILTVGNYDGRAISEMTVIISYKANGVAYSDWEYVTNWTQSLITMQLVNSATPDKLQTVSVAPWTGAPLIQINNNDARDITNVRLEVWFLIDGQVHYDYEDVDFNYFVLNKELEIVANHPGTPPAPGATYWDGEKYAGNILYTATAF